jgi:hypothetical protein
MQLERGEVEKESRGGHDSGVQSEAVRQLKLKKNECVLSSALFDFLPPLSRLAERTTTRSLSPRSLVPPANLPPFFTQRFLLLS